MDWVYFISGTFAFMVMSALIYIWGYRRSRKVPVKLHKEMRLALENKIMVYLADCPKGAAICDIARTIEGMAVGNQMQGYRLAVDNPLATAKAILADLEKRGLVTVKAVKNESLYIRSEL